MTDTIKRYNPISDCYCANDMYTTCREEPDGEYLNRDEVLTALVQRYLDAEDTCTENLAQCVTDQVLSNLQILGFSIDEIRAAVDR